MRGFASIWPVSLISAPIGPRGCVVVSADLGASGAEKCRTRPGRAHSTCGNRFYAPTLLKEPAELFIHLHEEGQESGLMHYAITTTDQPACMYGVCM